MRSGEAAGSAAGLPPELRGRHYSIQTTDPETGEPLVMTVRCDRPPTLEMVGAFQALAQAVALAVRNGLLDDADESYE